jgi:hypothetical protein
VSPSSLAPATPGVPPARTPAPRATLQRHLRVPGVRGAFPGRAEMRPMPAVLSSCRPWRTMPLLRRADRFGRPLTGDGLSLTATSVMPARATLLLDQPETGRGDASLWTAAAAPDHRLWTTLRGPLDPSRLPTSPLPRRRLRLSSEQPANHNHSKEDDRPYSGSVSASRHRSLSQALTGWAKPEYRSGPFRALPRIR